MIRHERHFTNGLRKLLTSTSYPSRCLPCPHFRASTRGPKLKAGLQLLPALQCPRQMSTCPLKSYYRALLTGWLSAWRLLESVPARSDCPPLLSGLCLDILPTTIRPTWKGNLLLVNFKIKVPDTLFLSSVTHDPWEGQKSLACSRKMSFQGL